MRRGPPSRRDEGASRARRSSSNTIHQIRSRDQVEIGSPAARRGAARRGAARALPPSLLPPPFPDVQRPRRSPSPSPSSPVAAGVVFALSGLWPHLKLLLTLYVWVSPT